MSKRQHILDGTNPDNLKKRFGLVYTCNCGWIDLGHLNSVNIRPEIGAQNLWRQLIQEAREYIHPCELISNMPKSMDSSHFINAKKFCEMAIEHPFSDSSPGFIVRYRQDHGGIVGKPGREGKYVVKKGLNQSQKKRVALAIFMEVSHRFEDLQSSFSFVTDSGYSQDDLVSNLLGFYIGVGEITQEYALKLSHPVSAKSALSIWDKESAVGANKNKKWEPLFARKTGYESDTQCLDECALAKREFPAEFQSIEPAPKGLWHAEIN